MIRVLLFSLLLYIWRLLQVFVQKEKEKNKELFVTYFLGGSIQKSDTELVGSTNKFSFSGFSLISIFLILVLFLWNRSWESTCKSKGTLYCSHKLPRLQCIKSQTIGPFSVVSRRFRCEQRKQNWPKSVPFTSSCSYSMAGRWLRGRSYLRFGSIKCVEAAENDADSNGIDTFDSSTQNSVYSMHLFCNNYLNDALSHFNVLGELWTT